MLKAKAQYVAGLAMVGGGAGLTISQVVTSNPWQAGILFGLLAIAGGLRLSAVGDRGLVR